MSRRVLAFACGAFLLPAAAHSTASPQARKGDSQSRTVHVYVTDEKGTPITDLTAADFKVKEAGKDREVVTARITNVPMHIALLVDDNGTGIFRYAIARFVERVFGRAEIAISAVSPQLVKVVDYTASADALSEAIGRLNARPGNDDGGQLLEAISETAKDLRKREARRPVIIALTVPGEEHSTLPARHVLDELRKSGAPLYVVSVAASAMRSTVAASKPSALLETNFNLNEVLGDGPRQSGGRREEIVATAGLALGLREYAEELLNQYALTYTVVEGIKSNQKLSVQVTRPGVSVRAPDRLPDK